MNLSLFLSKSRLIIINFLKNVQLIGDRASAAFEKLAHVIAISTHGWSNIREKDHNKKRFYLVFKKTRFTRSKKFTFLWPTADISSHRDESEITDQPTNVKIASMPLHNTFWSWITLSIYTPNHQSLAAIYMVKQFTRRRQRQAIMGACRSHSSQYCCALKAVILQICGHLDWYQNGNKTRFRSSKYSLSMCF